MVRMIRIVFNNMVMVMHDMYYVECSLILNMS